VSRNGYLHFASQLRYRSANLQFPTASRSERRQAKRNTDFTTKTNDDGCLFCCSTAQFGKIYWRFEGTCASITALMMEASNSETSVNLYQRTRCYNPEDSRLHTRWRQNLKSYFKRMNFSLPFNGTGSGSCRFGVPSSAVTVLKLISFYLVPDVNMYYSRLFRFLKYPPHWLAAVRHKNAVCTHRSLSTAIML
jgi:hypothetical protein